VYDGGGLAIKVHPGIRRAGTFGSTVINIRRAVTLAAIVNSIRRTVPSAPILIFGLCLCWHPATAQLQSDSGTPPVPAARKLSELNVSIMVFDPGVSADARADSRSEVYPNVRQVEALLLPFMLREKLVATDQWGAVRVVPEPDISAELLVSGKILRSDGDALELQLRTVDASGRLWLDKTYVNVEAVGPPQRSDMADGSLFEVLFQSIADDLQAVRDGYDDQLFSTLLEISFLRYAEQLAPAVFGGYLQHGSDGSFSIQRLPAEDDPMLARIDRIRQSEYLFIDTVDERFQELHDEIVSIYGLWLDYRQQVARYENSEIQRVQNDQSNAARGSYEAIKSLYDNYKWARMQDQRQDSRVQAFDNEVGPTVAEMESRVAELSDWLAQQYAEWRSILEEIFRLETGLPG
jgi:hypothetical protein